MLCKLTGITLSSYFTTKNSDHEKEVCEKCHDNILKSYTALGPP